MKAEDYLPKDGEVLRDWARLVVHLDGIERDLRVADKISVLEGIVDDPRGDCERALAAARAELGGNGDTKAVAGSQAQRDPAPDGDALDPAAVFIDWSTFWKRDYNESEWTYADVLARGRGHALYAKHKDGKSLLMLFIAAKLATGSEPIVVVYLDYEMTEADIFDRLEDMGYGPTTDLSRLRYALLPTLPPLDTARGADALTELVDDVQGEWPDHHLVVIIDTISRAVCGDENSADTVRAFYAFTGIQLKRRGITWARLDHGGKDPERGQRGSSGKGDDVDIVWKLARTENGVSLHRDFARMPWVLPTVTFGLSEDPLTYTRLAGDWPAGTGEIANMLDRLELPLDVSSRAAQTALKTIGEGRRRQLVLAAIRWRVELSEGAS